jgi:hypothetical protein
MGRKLILGEDIRMELIEVEKMEKQIGADPSDLLYSEKSEEVISYRQKVLEIESDKDDFLFWMAGNKGETIETLGRKTLSDIMSFAERINKENGRH